MIDVRDASAKDLELMMAWRSHPLVYAGFYRQKAPLMWLEHNAWWLARRNRKDWIIGVDGRWVGSVNVSSLNTDEPEIGVYVGETTSWGNGIGREAIAWAVRWLKNNGFKKARASIIKSNIGSQKAFEAVGFVMVGEGRKDERIYEIDVACNSM